MGDLSKHFSKSEFRCPCCGICIVSPKLLIRLERLRKRYGKPIYINSGYRCSEHNLLVGGVANSPHRGGWAADLKCSTDEERYLLLTSIFGRKHWGRRPLFNRVGIGPNFIHVDVDPDKNPKRIWGYWK